MTINERNIDLTELIAGAVEKGLVNPDRADALAAYLQERRKVGLAKDETAEEMERETPKVIRGFHDALIALGALLSIVGLALLTELYYVIPLIVILAEILMRRQNLPFTGILLTGALNVAVFNSGRALLDFKDVHYNVALLAIFTGCSLGLFFWRYRIPLAFAGSIAASAAALLAGIEYFMEQGTGDAMFAEHHLAYQALLAGLFFTITFVAALYFDLSPVRRHGNRGERAFWLHLAAAPSLMLTFLLSISAISGKQIFINTNLSEAWATVGAVICMALLGLALNRRVFVTAGLLSLGYALATFIYKLNTSISAGAREDKILASVIILLGFSVLLLGIGWNPLRRLLLSILPRAMRSRLPEAL